MATDEEIRKASRMTKIKPIVRGNIVVWPVIPSLTAGVKIHDQSPRNASPDNVVIIPVAHVTRKTISEAQYNDIQKVVAKTMRGQRYTKRSQYALDKLRKMHLNPA